MTTDAQSMRAIAAGYRVLGRLRRGPDSAVYRAVRDEDDVEVVLKVLLSEAYPIDEEAANLRRLPRHPNLVRVLGTGRTVHGFPFFAMEYHPEGSYADLLARSGPIPVEEAIRVGRAVAEALDAVHGVGLLHRDVTPANILRGADGPLLTDFGIAAMPDELSGTVALDRLTPHHAAPEALLREAQDGRSDVYGLASTVWTLLAGHPPFAAPDQQSPDPFEYRESALRRALPSVPREDVPPWLQEVLRRAMAKAPADRYPGAAAFATALRDRRAPDEVLSTSESAPVIQVPAPGSAPTGHTMPTPPAPVEVSGRGSAGVASGAAASPPLPVSEAAAGSAPAVAGPDAGAPARTAGSAARVDATAKAGSAAEARTVRDATGSATGSVTRAGAVAGSGAGAAAGRAASKAPRDGDSEPGARPARAGSAADAAARSAGAKAPRDGGSRAGARLREAGDAAGSAAASAASEASPDGGLPDGDVEGERAASDQTTGGAAGGRPSAAPSGPASGDDSKAGGRPSVKGGSADGSAAAGGRAGSASRMGAARAGAAGGYAAAEQRAEAARAPAEETSALVAERPAAEEPTALLEEPTALVASPPPVALEPPPAVAQPVAMARPSTVDSSASAGHAWQRAEAHSRVPGGWVEAQPRDESTAAVRTEAVATGYAGYQTEAEALPAYQIAGYAAEDAAPGYAAPDVGGLRFDSDEPDDVLPPDRRRGVSKVAVGVAAVVIGLSAALIGTLAYRGLTDDAPPEAKIVPGAPEDVRLADERFAVTLSWRDVTEGNAIVYVVGGPRGKTPSTMASAARGATSVRVNGVNPEVDYCFRLVAAFSVDEVATSGESCTARFGASPTPS